MQALCRPAEAEAYDVIQCLTKQLWPVGTSYDRGLVWPPRTVECTNNTMNNNNPPPAPCAANER
jgi:hypothetical protein